MNSWSSAENSIPALTSLTSEMMDSLRQTPANRAGLFSILKVLLRGQLASPPSCRCPTARLRGLSGNLHHSSRVFRRRVTLPLFAGSNPWSFRSKDIRRATAGLATQHSNVYNPAGGRRRCKARSRRIRLINPAIGLEPGRLTLYRPLHRSLKTGSAGPGIHPPRAP